MWLKSSRFPTGPTENGAGKSLSPYSEIHSKVELPGMLGTRRKGNVGKSGINGVTAAPGTCTQVVTD